MEKKIYEEPACIQTMVYMEHIICGSNYEDEIELVVDDIDIWWDVL